MVAKSRGTMVNTIPALAQKAAALEALDKALELDPQYAPARINRMAIAKMTQGEPFLPSAIQETEFYRDQIDTEAARGKRGSRRGRFWRGTM
jgi:hypothetical protein